MQEQQNLSEQQEQQEQQPKQPQKKKKKNSSWAFIIVILVSLVFISMFPLGFVKYSDGATRLITPVTTIVINKTDETLWTNGEYRIAKPEIDLYFIPNNFKSYEELLVIKDQREAQKPQE